MTLVQVLRILWTHILLESLSESLTYMALLFKILDWHKADLVQASKQSCDEWPRMWNHIASGVSSVKNQVVKEYTIARMKNDHFEKFVYCWSG